ncbi:hypothetical protein NDI37_10015 [Funiculus sociatus GB2-A5]|uniref:Uncharacterized protein n=1 Tax=Funiculus sociatus GB2-A5 TaxID=2933946 RepID=A0ABV0JN31_9CYAN|nr:MULTISPECIES: hypothetical protein [unclassified Trichocoleus]MBD1907834.1 hypothetical protein [Trichocoleus sp. FACHB-832]MBD2064012.1 hypothetical protein [Trichocoleus sp. FACHB-6]
MNTKGTVVFDIIGTCFSLDKPRQRLVELDAPPHALELWFAQTLRDARPLPCRQLPDAQGAACAVQTAFINKEEKDYLGVYPQPEIIASDLVEAANRIVEE